MIIKIYFAVKFDAQRIFAFATFGVVVFETYAHFMNTTCYQMAFFRIGFCLIISKLTK